jgi:hypothetical protein
MTRTDAQARAIHRQDGAGQDPAEEANDTVLGWLAMVLPSWGTSVMFHLAIFLMIAFFSTTGGAQQEVWHPGPIVLQDTQRPAKMDKSLVKKDHQVPQGDKHGSPRGHFKPQPSSFAVEHLNLLFPGPDPLANNSDRVKVIGIGPGGGRQTGGEGLGIGNGRPLGDGIFDYQQIEFPEAAKIVYVVDRSGSMSDSLDYVKMELKRSLGELGPDKQFNIIFFSSGPALEMPARRLVTATEASKRQAYAFIDEVVAHGETDPSEAFQRAFAVKPDVIFFLTDGEFDKSIVDQVNRANAGKKVVVNTIAFLYKQGEPLLKQIAADNGGNYKFVAEADLGR